MIIGMRIGVLAMAWLGAMSSPAFAFKPTDREMATLPPYCAARFDSASAGFKTWRDTMGGDFMHIHHYCAGLNFLNRAYGMAPGKNREGTLGGAVRNFDYVLTHVQPGFYLRPEVLMHRGMALSLANKPGEAMGNLNQAIAMNAKLPRAYLTLADMHVKQKSRAKALEIVTEGLRHNPEVRSLQKRYAELGGTLPYPQPVVAPVDTGEGTPAAAPPGPTAVETAPPTSGASAVEPIVAPTASEQKIGSPKNPYCRFCPD